LSRQCCWSRRWRWESGVGDDPITRRRRFRPDPLTGQAPRCFSLIVDATTRPSPDACGSDNQSGHSMLMAAASRAARRQRNARDQTLLPVAGQLTSAHSHSGTIALAHCDATPPSHATTGRRLAAIAFSCHCAAPHCARAVRGAAMLGDGRRSVRCAAALNGRR